MHTNSTPPLSLILTTAPGNGSGNSIINSWLASGGNGNSNINSPTGGREWNSNILVAPWTSLVCRCLWPFDFDCHFGFCCWQRPTEVQWKILPEQLKFRMISFLLSVGRGPRRYTNILFVFLFRILLSARGRMQRYNEKFALGNLCYDFFFVECRPRPTEVHKHFVLISISDFAGGSGPHGGTQTS